MMNFINKLKDIDFIKLLEALGKTKSGDSRICDYFDENEKRKIWLYNNGPFFNDNTSEEIWINDYGTSEKNNNVAHNVFMLHQFGDNWFASAKKHFEESHNADGLETLKAAKTQYEKELESNKEILESQEDEEPSSK